MKRPHFSYNFVLLKILSIICWTKALASQTGVDNKFLNLGSPSAYLSSTEACCCSGKTTETRSGVIRPVQLQHGHPLPDLRSSQRCCKD